ncbi:MAG TPA: acyl-CoA dehydrogenase family protein [Candidatus Angelobacter sp.]|nr:acyl-CoA dehydrogenase family protein [Candidatus Angelobacter sp.]
MGQLESAAPKADAATAGMKMELSDAQKESRLRFRDFVQQHISPFAGQWDREQRVPLEIVDALRARGYLGAVHPTRNDHGGPMDLITYGLLTEELARGCSSVRSLLTVHDMVSLGIWRWGSRDLKAQYGTATASAQLLCALALSEPEAGSDAASVSTMATLSGDEYLLTGTKKWITFGQIADLFLVLARCQNQVDQTGQLAAFLVPATSSGLTRTALTGIVGTRASLLAQLDLHECRIPKSHLVGRIGFGLTHVVATVLDHGRYSVAWGSVGIAQACLDACLDYTSQRKQFGRELRDHQLVQQKLTDMIASTRAARLLCYRAGYLRETQDPGATAETLLAKYFASRAAVNAANDAVHLHGANGLTEEYEVARYLRDAKVMEIIEGSTEIQQITIPKFSFSEL